MEPELEQEPVFWDRAGTTPKRIKNSSKLHPKTSRAARPLIEPMELAWRAEGMKSVSPTEKTAERW